MLLHGEWPVSMAAVEGKTCWSKEAVGRRRCWMCSGCQEGEGRPVAKLERQRGKKKPKGKLGERGAAACVKENGVGAAAGKMDGVLCCWLAKEKEMGEVAGYGK